MTDRADTRRQLVDMRARLIGNLGERIEGGDLTLLAAVNGAIRAGFFFARAGAARPNSEFTAER
jgi:hypothetical protein